MTTRTDRLQAVFLAILLAIGAGLVWGLVVGWTLITIDDVVFAVPQTRERIVVMRDGTPLVESTWEPNYQPQTYRTLDGKRTDASRSQVEVTALLNRPGWPRDGFTRLPWSERITQLYRDQFSAEVWYFVHDGNLQGHAHMVGYDKSTKLTIGYIGRNGFRTDAPPPEDQFPVNGHGYRYWRYFSMFRIKLGSDYFLTDEGLERIDWDKRKTQLVWKDDSPISVAIWYGHNADDNTPINPRILVRTVERVRVLDIDGNEQETFALPAELRDAPQLQWTPLLDGKALAWSFVDDNVFWLDASGVVRQEKFDLHRAVRASDRKGAMFLSLAAPVPAGFAVIIALAPRDPVYSDAGSYWTRLARVLADVWPGLLPVAAIGVVLAWLCYRRQCKFGLPWTPVWVAMVLLLGLPAYLGYLAHRQWPACLPCPSCGRLVPRDRPACFACHRDFPTPAAKGTEVFA